MQVDRNLPEPDGTDASREAAYDFMHKIGLDPTPDAIGQLAGPFAEALRIMCERGYDREGRTWRDKGWRGLVHDILNKAGRIRFHSWSHSRFDPDSAIDIINFGGFYWRQRNNGPRWGTWGEPGD
jgi:hypothetical protein